MANFITLIVLAQISQLIESCHFLRLCVFAKPLQSTNFNIQPTIQGTKTIHST